MGIERFFNNLAKNKIIKNNSIVTGFKKAYDIEHLFIDFNSIVYNVVSEIETTLNYLLYDIILFEHDKKELSIKSKEISEKWNFELTNVSVLKYKEHFTSIIIDNYAMMEIKNTVIHISSVLIEPEQLKSIYIAIDGTPQMGKLIEQKKRRYMGYIESKFKKNIYNEKFDFVSEKRKIYEKNKVTYDRGRIISYTRLMKTIQEVLSSDEFLIELKIKNINLEKYILSHQEIFGEGEKKIMDYIIQQKIKGRYGIYSPDADVIILGIIIGNVLNDGSEIMVLKFNQQTKEYDSTHINMLCDSIFEYVVKYSNVSESLLNKINIINDISYLFTLFGNDFVPKMESINAEQDIQLIIDCYCSTLITDKKISYIMFMNPDGQYKINYINFFNIIKNIADIEDILLYDVFMSSKYKNYSQYKKNFGVDKLFSVIHEYTETANKLFADVRAGELANVIIKRYADTDFIKLFLNIESFVRNVKDMNSQEIMKIYESKINRMLDDYRKGNKIKGKLKMQLRDEDNIDDNYHKKKMMENLPHPYMDITEYDKEIYKLEKRIGEYQIKLNATNFDLGSVSIETTYKGDYQIKIFNKLENIVDYYETFFNISHTKKYIKTSKGTKSIIVFDDKLDDLVENYMRGLFWVFDNYFNSKQSDNISTWFYKYNRAPLLYQIKEYLNKYIQIGIPEFNNQMNKIYSSIAYDKKNFSNITEFITPLEQYIYVVPKNKWHDVPDEYRDVINKYPILFPDMEALCGDIWSKKENMHLIETKRVSYMTKGHLKNVKFIEYNEFINLIKHLRKKNPSNGLLFTKIY
jgi:5'-3' exonuclease